MIPISVPTSLSKITPFIRRAEELDRIRANPQCRVVAHFCRKYAAEMAFSIAATEEETDCLEKILSQVQVMGEYVSIYTEEESYALCKNFADCKFTKADAEDRAGAADKNVAKLFYASATFYEMLKQFHAGYDDDDDDDLAELEKEGQHYEYEEQMEEENQRRLYAKQRAVQILRAIKENRPILPGRYKREEDHLLDSEDLLGAEGSGSDASLMSTTLCNALPEIQLLVRLLRTENAKLKASVSSSNDDNNNNRNNANNNYSSSSSSCSVPKHEYQEIKRQYAELQKEYNDCFGYNHENKSLEELNELEETLRESLQRVVTQREKTMKARLEEEEEKRTCVICQVERKSVLLMPCRHLCVCGECGQRCELTKCPLCRQAVMERINVYS